MSRYVFDFDNTVVFTNAANNAAYNRALRTFGLEEIFDAERLTRERVFEEYPHLPETTRGQIIQKKQELFSPDETEINGRILDLLRQLGPPHCMLWSRADRHRVESILDHHGIRSYFRSILFSDKNDYEADIRYICELFSCSSCDLIVFDDETIYLQKAVASGCTAMLVSGRSLQKYTDYSMMD